MSTSAYETRTGNSRRPATPPAVAPNTRRAETSMRPQSGDPDTARAIVLAVIKRVEGYVEEETKALKNSLSFDLKASNDRKSQGLLDLNQALRRLQRSDLNTDLQTRLDGFRQKLDANLRAIRLHLEAVKEIAGVLSDAIQNAESDGTYTRRINPYRSAP